jgi:hypothetical protein
VSIVTSKQMIWMPTGDSIARAVERLVASIVVKN